MQELIQVQALTKHFGPIHAVNDISFAVKKGEVLGFLGPNGAGKSTTMKMITGFLTPTGGTAKVCGFDVLEHPLDAKRHLGYLPEGAPLYADMTPSSFLSFIASARGMSGSTRKAAIERAVKRVQIAHVMDQPIETLSKGFKRRVGLAQALLHDPDVLVLDEPTDGLDPNQKHDVRNLIREMAHEKAIIISTHILEEVSSICTRAIIIAAGKIVADGTPSDLEARSKTYNTVIVRFTKPALEAAQTALGKIAGVARVEPISADQGFALRVSPNAGQPILSAVSAQVRDAGWEVQEIRVDHGHLDDVFRDITRSAR
ncbi:MAG: ABC transporter ATP-binding protein [Alphaproteobacteria bacterium]